ncbi:MAG: DUF4252 domain-containing protein [Tannerella sp.]|jgi:hypothetical protein|nr:DUF4252 domain-containing protein [Tannerella sp.]
MKKLAIILSVFLIAGSVGAEEPGSRSFVKQYSGQEGYSVVTIKKTALKLLSMVARAGGTPKEEMAIFSRIDDIQVLSCPARKDKADAFEGALLGFCETNGYESLLQSEESGEVVQIYCALKEDAITSFMIWSRKGDMVETVFLNGRFTAEDMKKMMDKKGKNFGW